MATGIQQPLQLFLAKLERQNRTLKRFGLLLFLVCFSAIGLLAWQFWKLSRKVTLGAQTKMISTTQLNLVDEKGNMQGMLAGTSEGAIVFLNGPNDKRGLMFAPIADGSSLSLSSPNGKREVNMDAADAFSWVKVGGKGRTDQRIEIVSGSDGSAVTVHGDEKFQAVLGSASLYKADTGESKQTSAGTLTLFGKDGQVVSMIPR